MENLTGTSRVVRAAVFAAFVLGLLLPVFAPKAVSAQPVRANRGQSASELQFLQDIPPIIITADYVEGGAPRPAARQDALRQEALGASAQSTADIRVKYFGAWDPAAQAAFELACQIWESLIVSSVPIQVEADWENLTEEYGSPHVLGGASASDYWKDFSPLAISNTWYPSALANQLAGADLEPGMADIEASFNSAFPDWYFGLDGNPPNHQYDLVSVALHELGHGLGFSGSMTVSTNGSWGYGTGSPFIYDTFVINGLGQSLLDINLFPNDSEALAVQLQSGDLHFNGRYSVSVNNALPAKVYAPGSWQQGSSFSHLDEETYTVDTGSALMTPQLKNGEVIREPGALILAIFQDLGWTVSLSNVVPTPDPTPEPTQEPTPDPTPVTPPPQPRDPPTDWIFLPLTQR